MYTLPLQFVYCETVSLSWSHECFMWVSCEGKLLWVRLRSNYIVIRLPATSRNCLTRVDTCNIRTTYCLSRAAERKEIDSLCMENGHRNMKFDTWRLFFWDLMKVDVNMISMAFMSNGRDIASHIIQRNRKKKPSSPFVPLISFELNELKEYCRYISFFFLLSPRSFQGVSDNNSLPFYFLIWAKYPVYNMSYRYIH